MGTLATVLAGFAVLAVVAPLLAGAMHINLGTHRHAHKPNRLGGNSGVEPPEGEAEGEGAVEAGGAIEEPVLESLSPLEPAPDPETVAESEPVAEPEVAPAVEAPTVESPEVEPAPEPEPVPEPEAEPAPVPPAGGAPLYWGAWIGNQLTGNQPPWDMTAVSAFEQMTGKGLSVVQFGTPFANCAAACYTYDFPAGPMQSIRNHGSIPFLSWASQSIPSSKEEPDFQLADVIAGTYDSYIHEFATAAKSWAHPFFLRFNWEMNGRWFPWSEGVNGNQPGEYVAAWRHVHDIFAAVGADNATWVWCPNIDPENIFLDLASQYPGDAYVDWTCLDGYNWGTNPAKPDRWRSFDQLYSTTYHEITDVLAPSKPMIIGEMASTEYGGSKAAWISDALATVPAQYPKVRGLLWFEKLDSNMDWPIETSVSATEAFAAGIQSGVFRGNEYADLGASPIPPPG